MIALFLSSIISLFLWIVFGVFIAKKANILAGFSEKALLGLAASNTIATIISLFFPINSYVLILFLIICFFLTFFIKEEILQLFRFLKLNKNIIIYALPCIVIAYFISLDYPHNYDSGLYHLQSIKWIEQYSAVPGLANLHGRFGYNPNIFTFFALTSLNDIFKQEIFSVNFALFIILCIYFADKLYMIFKKDGITNLFVLNCIVIITIFGMFRNLSSPTPDYIALCFPLFIFMKIINSSMFFAQSYKNTNIENKISILILCAYVITVKLSAFPMIMLPSFIIFRHKFTLNQLKYFLFIVGLIFVPWMMRNVILTGYLAYPVPSLNFFNFEWQVPISTVIADKKEIVYWARLPGENYRSVAYLSTIEWVRLWCGNQNIVNMILFVFSIISPMIIFVCWLFKKIKFNFELSVAVITVFIGVLFWFCTAPDFRFGEGYVVLSASIVLTVCKFRVRSFHFPSYLKIIAILIVIIISYPLSINRHFKRVVYQIPKRWVKPQIFQIPADLRFDTYDICGITVYVPLVDARCFTHDLPCTPYPNPNLILRGNNLQSGFKFK